MNRSASLMTDLTNAEVSVGGQPIASIGELDVIRVNKPRLSIFYFHFILSHLRTLVP